MSSAEAFASKLPNAVMGEVVTRFAPEPSGYLHIGHVKAALLNDFFATWFKGKMLLRFDDTNPSKEKMEYERSIENDLRMLGINFEGPSYTSDEIPKLAEALKKLISKGLAYCDDLPVEEMRHNRMEGIPSPNREGLTVEENLRLFDEMLAGSEQGQKFCVRAKIDMSNPNKALRDPVFWRVNVAIPHHRHGTKFKSYPTYDFACPIVDSWSGVTHALRANEYADRIPMYEWVIKTMELRPVTVWEFSRLNLTNTVLSKRKLSWLVETGIVEGWDDPRFPTVRGMIRRGLSVEALRNFIIEQGPSKNANLMTWDKLWAGNTKVYDNDSARAMAVAANAKIRLKLTDLAEDLPIEKPVHPRRSELGVIKTFLSKSILLEKEDADLISEGEEITLMRYGNAIIDRKVVDPATGSYVLEGRTHPDGNVKTTKLKLHWVPELPNAFTFGLREYDHVINKVQPEEGDEMADIVNKDSLHTTVLIGEAYLADVKEGEVVQLERRGYARRDRVYNQDGVDMPMFILIPTGKVKSMSTLSVKVDSQRLAKGDLGNEPAAHGPSKKELKKQAWLKSQAAAAQKKEQFEAAQSDAAQSPTKSVDA